MAEPQTTNLETCDRCCGTGWMHPDNPAGKCTKCNGSGGIPRMTVPSWVLWHGAVRLSWRTDCFGRVGRSLCAGHLNIGHIMQWSGSDNPRAGEWRAWLMTDEDGTEIGWYPTEQEAKDALLDAAVKELCK